MIDLTGKTDLPFRQPLCILSRLPFLPILDEQAEVPGGWRVGFDHIFIQGRSQAGAELKQR